MDSDAQRPLPSRHRTLLALVSLALILAASVACTSTSPQATAPAAPAITADTWAVVDGRTITRDAVEQAYRRVSDPSQPVSDEEAMGVKFTLLNDIIVQDLLLAKARELKVEPTTAEVDAAFAEARKGVPDDVFQQELIRRNYTADSMREGLRRELVGQKVIEREVQSKVVVSDQDVTAFFNANREQFNITEEAHRVAQIVITPARDQRLANRTGDDATTVEAARTKVEMLMGRLKSGASFAELAMDYSEDPDTAPRGGDLGLVPISQLRQAPQALRDAVLNSPAGTVNVASAGGGHIIVLVLAHEKPGQRDLSSPEVRQNITELLRTRREQVLRAAYLTTLRNGASVQNYLAERLVESRGGMPSLGLVAPTAK